jgi:putative OPT family oligopeptide transporter
LSALLTIFVLTSIGTFAIYDFLIQSVYVSLVATSVMIVAAFLFVAVATYIVGLVGSSNSPVSGMTICALLMAAAVLTVLGIKGESAMLAVLGVAGVVACAACTSGDIAQDLKTGILVGATPARQQWCEILAVIVPAFIFAPVMSFLHKAYVIGEGLRAPQAGLFASLTQGFFGDGDLPMTMIYIGAGIGVAIIVSDLVLKEAGARMRLHVMPVAVGIYLPVALGVPIFIGGLIRYFVSRARAAAKNEAQDTGVLFGSGLIAGEALMGIGLAVPISLQWTLWKYEAHWGWSLLLFAAVIGVFGWLANWRINNSAG